MDCTAPRLHFISPHAAGCCGPVSPPAKGWIKSSGRPDLALGQGLLTPAFDWSQWENKGSVLELIQKKRLISTLISCYITHTLCYGKISDVGAITRDYCIFNAAIKGQTSCNIKPVCAFVSLALLYLKNGCLPWEGNCYWHVVYCTFQLTDKG